MIIYPVSLHEVDNLTENFRLKDVCLCQLMTLIQKAAVELDKKEIVKQKKLGKNLR